MKMVFQKGEKQDIHYIPKRTWGSLRIFYVMNSRFVRHNVLKKEMETVKDNLNSGALNNSHCFYVNIWSWAKTWMTYNLVLLEIYGEKNINSYC